MKKDEHHFIRKAIHHVGGLHRMLDIPQGQHIPIERIEAATHSSNTLLRERAHFAMVMHGLPPPPAASYRGGPKQAKGRARG